MLENQLYSSTLYRRWATGTSFAFDSNDDGDVDVSVVKIIYLLTHALTCIFYSCSWNLIWTKDRVNLV